MKLQQLNENEQYPIVRKLLNAGLQLDKKFGINDLAWIAAAMASEYIDEWDWDDKAYLLYRPDKGFKGTSTRSRVTSMMHTY